VIEERGGWEFIWIGHEVRNKPTNRRQIATRRKQRRQYESLRGGRKGVLKYPAMVYDNDNLLCPLPRLPPFILLLGVTRSLEFTEEAE
jgi:hypothetical protein